MDERKAARERRQAKIRAAGADRLTKITGSVGSEDFKAPVQRAELVTATVPPTSDDADPPIDSIPTSTQDELDAPQFPGFDQFPDLAQFPGLNQLLNQLPSDASGQQSQAPFNRMQQHSQHPQHPSQVMYSTPRQDFWWSVLHVVLAIAVGAYSTFNPFLLMRLFVVVEILLHSARFIFGYRPPARALSLVAPFLGMLPPRIQRWLADGAAVIQVAIAAYRDLSVVLFTFVLVSRYIPLLSGPYGSVVTD